MVKPNAMQRILQTFRATDPPRRGRLGFGQVGSALYRNSVIVGRTARPETADKKNPSALSADGFRCQLVLLPAIVRERLVGLGHTVGVFLLLHGVAFALAGRDHFGGELLGHRLLITAAGERDQPAHRQRSAAVRTNFDRHLVRRAADAAALNFDGGLEVGQSLLEDGDSGLRRLVLDDIHRAVEDSLGSGLLALVHDGVDELRNGLAIVACVRKNRTLDRLFATAHFFFPPAAPPALGFLVPYFERLLLRPLTPDASSEPRTM